MTESCLSKSNPDYHSITDSAADFGDREKIAKRNSCHILISPFNDLFRFFFSSEKDAVLPSKYINLVSAASVVIS